MKQPFRPLGLKSHFISNTRVTLLRSRADQYLNRLAYRFFQDSGPEIISITDMELDRRARTIGVWLDASGAKGERALLLYAPRLDFIASFTCNDYKS